MGSSSLIGYASSSVSKLCREGGPCLTAFRALTMNATVIIGLWLERQKTRYSIPSEIVRLHHDLHQTLRDADSIGRRLMTLNEQLMVQLHQWIRRRG